MRTCIIPILVGLLTGGCATVKPTSIPTATEQTVEPVAEPTLATNEECLQKKPSSSPCLANWVLLKCRSGECDAARARVDALKEQFPEEAGPHIGSAFAFLYMGDLKGAEKEGRLAIAADFRNRWALYVMARVFYAQHKWEAAKMVLDEALKIDPNDGLVLLWLGHVTRKLSNDNEAFTFYQKAADLRADLPDALDHVVDGYTRRNELDKAQAYLDQLIKIAGNKAKVSLLEGNLRLKQKRFKEAREAYERALAEDGRLNITHYNLGLLYLEAKELVPDDLERYSLAKGAFEKYAESTKLLGDESEKIQKYVKSLSQRIQLETTRRAQKQKEIEQPTQEPKEQQ